MKIHHVRSHTKLVNAIHDENADEITSKSMLFEADSRQKQINLHIDHTSTPVCLTSTPTTTPNISSIHSPISSIAPNSPKSDVSYSSKVLRKELNSKLRRYQRKKSTEINILKRALLKIQKQNQMYKKRLQRLQKVIKTSLTIIKKTKNLKIVSPKEKRVRTLVNIFYEDDHNSRLCPGKRDCITRN